MSPDEYKDKHQKVVDRTLEICEEKGYDAFVIESYYNPFVDCLITNIRIEKEVYQLWNNGNNCGYKFLGKIH